MKEYRTLAAKEARIYGEEYADYIEQHTLGLIERGYLPETAINHSLSERLIGNDSI